MIRRARDDCFPTEHKSALTRVKKQNRARTTELLQHLIPRGKAHPEAMARV